MKLGAFAFLAVLTLGFFFRGHLRCWVRGRHDTVAHPLGGRRCASCGGAFADLAEAGELPAGGYVDTMRPRFDRRDGSFERGVH